MDPVNFIKKLEHIYLLVNKIHFYYELFLGESTILYMKTSMVFDLVTPYMKTKRFLDTYFPFK